MTADLCQLHDLHDHDGNCPNNCPTCDCADGAA